MKGPLKYLLFCMVLLFATAVKAQTITVVNDTVLGKSTFATPPAAQPVDVPVAQKPRTAADSAKMVRDSIMLARKNAPKKPKPIRTEISGGFRLNTDGWSVFVDKGWVVSEAKKRDYFYNTKLVQLEFGEKKHPKESRVTNAPNPYSGDKPRAFVYAKMNNFYTAKLGYGMRKMIAGKPEYKAVSVHWVYMAGLSAGLLKPYYLDVDSPISRDRAVNATIKYTEESNDTTKAIFLTRQLINGSAGWGKGLDELSIVPGGFLKTALHFDFAASKFNIAAIEAGVNFEMYSKKIALMAEQEAHPYFVNIYASIQFGKRKQ